LPFICHWRVELMAVRPQRIGNRISGLLLVGVVLLGLALGAVFASSSRLSVVLMYAVGALALPLLVWAVFDLRVGVVSIFAAGFFVLYIKRLAWNVQVGLAIDAILVLLLFGLLLQFAQGRRLVASSFPTTWLLLLNLFYCAVAIFNPLAPSLSNGIYAIRFLALYSLIYFVALFLMDIPIQSVPQGAKSVGVPQILRLFVGLWLVLATIVALYGLYQHLVGFSHYEQAWLQRSPTHFLGGTIRIFSTLGGTDILGTNMAVSLVLAVAFVFGCRQWRWRLATMASIPLLALTLVYTQTRGSYAGAAAGLVVLAAVTRDRRLVGVLLAVLLLISAYVVALPDDYYAQRILSTLRPAEDASFQVRQENIGSNLPEVFSHPFGVGPGSSGYRGRQLLSTTDVMSLSSAAQRAYTATDSYYFKLALELGPVGLGIFVAILSAVGIAGWRAYRRARSPFARWMVAGLLSAIVVIAVNSIANDCFEHTPNNLFYWFSAGLIVALSRGPGSKETVA
jgi:hypothetical protein